MILSKEIFSIELSQIFKSEKYVVIDSAPCFAYRDGKRTDTVVATKYTLADPISFKNFEVKVNGPASITNDVINNSDAPILVTLTNAKIVPYSIQYGKAECTAIADTIKIVKTNNN